MRSPFLMLAIFVLIAVSGCAPPSGDPDVLCSGKDLTERVRTADHCLVVRTFESSGRGDAGTLVLVLHGDSPSELPSYQYLAAQRIAERNENVVAVGMLRPGYRDGQGGRSSGVRGRTTGDNYTADTADAVANALRRLAEHHATERIVVVGHSGGAAIAALVVSRHRGVVDRAVLIGCPCDLPRWREHMYAVQSAEAWREPVESLSPLDLAADFDPDASVIVVVGSADRVAPPALSDAYAAALLANGKTAELVVLPGKGHNILLDVDVDEIIDEAIRVVPAVSMGRSRP